MRAGADYALAHRRQRGPNACAPSGSESRVFIAACARTLMLFGAPIFDDPEFQRGWTAAANAPAPPPALVAPPTYQQPPAIPSPLPTVPATPAANAPPAPANPKAEPAAVSPGSYGATWMIPI